MLNTSLRGVTSRGIGQWRRRAPTMECGAYASREHKRSHDTARTDVARDRSTRTRVADWGARARRHVITAHDNILEHRTPNASTHRPNAFLLTTVFTLRPMPVAGGAHRAVLYFYIAYEPKVRRYISIQSIYDSSLCARDYIHIAACVRRAFHGVCGLTYITYLSDCVRSRYFRAVVVGFVKSISICIHSICYYYGPD